ncbi:TIGR04222 domain-containing membrane protein [Streptomyces ipomoeae]|uniref:TIGR04222 domain-containing membrane protein n=1 Tax=Streptomyces ipomoeae TaxID=103232 RepID=UPI0015F0E317|nr:TIGR04222 domain-containing membrane protein [Streptomyces ipomoeae]MDX2936861.1 TIGR04222 domain-containing membrane protein [Streptomyces ipomoeae]
MRLGFRRSVAAAGEENRALDVYDVAFLAGGAHRVADSAVIALAERGLVTVRGSRVRAVGRERPHHPVERVLIASCLRSRTVVAVHTALQRSPEVEEIARRLAARGLVTGSRRRLTRAGRRRLRTAEQDGNLPAYVFDGPAVLPRGPVRRGIATVHPIPSGLGRALVRMGKTLDHDYEYDYDSDADTGSGPGSDSGSGGGFSCGGGGGGGD